MQALKLCSSCSLFNVCVKFLDEIHSCFFLKMNVVHLFKFIIKKIWNIFANIHIFLCDEQKFPTHSPSLLAHRTIKKAPQIFLAACLLFLVFVCIYLIKYRSNLNENFFFKSVIAMPIILEFLKTL